jgi:uracil-DNA glycosylase
LQNRREKYCALVQARKKCRACEGLVNPSNVESGAFDSDQIGPWSRWQGNLNAELMIVGQDWGDTRYFIANHGHESSQNPTNDMLIRLLSSIGVDVPAPTATDSARGPLFLTNAILCLKEGGLQAAVKREWFEQCAARFLRPTIDIVAPRILISLGEWAYRAINRAYDLQRMSFQQAVKSHEGFLLTAHMLYFPRYHCGRRILNTHRPLALQQADWQLVEHAMIEGRRQPG